MTQEPFQEQVQARKEKPAPSTSVAEPPKCQPRKEGAMIELTDTDLQAISGGGSKPGLMGGSGEC